MVCGCACDFGIIVNLIFDILSTFEPSIFFLFGEVEGEGA